MKDRYFRFEGAGDQHCGLVVSELPTSGRLFAMLPPQFDLSRANISTTLLKMIPDVFPYVGRKCLSMLKYGLASLLTHESWLRANLPNTSLIWLSPLFTDREATRPLKDAIVPISHFPCFMQGVSLLIISY